MIAKIVFLSFKFKKLKARVFSRSFVFYEEPSNKNIL